MDTFLLDAMRARLAVDRIERRFAALGTIQRVADLTASLSHLSLVFFDGLLGLYWRCLDGNTGNFVLDHVRSGFGAVWIKES